MISSGEGALSAFFVAETPFSGSPAAFIRSARRFSGTGLESRAFVFCISSSERVISTEQGKKLATSLGMKYFEISCKINMNIPEVMSQMIMESYMTTNHIDNCFRLSKGKSEIEFMKQNYF